LKALLGSSNGEFFQNVEKYLTANDYGKNFPLFNIVSYINGTNNPLKCIVFEYDKTEKQPIFISLENGKQHQCHKKQIAEYKERLLLSNEFSAAQVGGEEIVRKNPKNRAEAKKRHDWEKFLAAENEEIKRAIEMAYLTDFRKNKPDGVFIHTTRFVYQINWYTDGTIDKYKVRLVFRGFSMVLNRDFFDVYAPVTQMISMKLFYFVILYYGFKNSIWDVKSAFLQADMDTDVWCTLPDGFSHDGCRYARVNRAIPGVKQGAYLWYRKFQLQLISDGFSQQEIEPCLFILWESHRKIILLIHVDNILVGTDHPEEWKKIISKWPFQCNEVHNSSILGLQCERISKHVVTFSQRNYIEELIKEFSMEEFPSLKIPLRNGIEKDYDPESMSKTNLPDLPFKSLNMKLYWIARSFRVHILYACNFFARFSHCYNEKLYKEMLNVILYLKGTIDWKLTFQVDPDVTMALNFACDADLAMSRDRRSTYGSVGWAGGRLPNLRTKFNNKN